MAEPGLVEEEEVAQQHSYIFGKMENTVEKRSDESKGIEEVPKSFRFIPSLASTSVCFPSYWW